MARVPSLHAWALMGPRDLSAEVLLLLVILFLVGFRFLGLPLPESLGGEGGKLVAQELTSCLYLTSGLLLADLHCTGLARKRQLDGDARGTWSEVRWLLQLLCFGM
eukprot:TRINITY_DN92665_c0_g1_i1.p1 TRINITY_DN92665_c0_g1~~TRINITY_DN92665_c0_g1_i1.p1  ORF type:complete len:106 (+),score=13.79 TRINITY_DN92665_c0_g1_i1:65-382(+)